MTSPDADKAATSRRTPQGSARILECCKLLQLSPNGRAGIEDVRDVEVVHEGEGATANGVWLSCHPGVMMTTSVVSPEAS
ncbi:MAG TPA: hypothetical protein VGA56_25610 [Opitutaceae bacterium]